MKSFPLHDFTCPVYGFHLDTSRKMTLNPWMCMHGELKSRKIMLGQGKARADRAGFQHAQWCDFGAFGEWCRG